MPRIDDRGATFEWAGEARQVVVTGSWCDWRAESALRLRRGRDGSWTGHLALPPEAYVQYRLMVDGEAVADPSGGRRTHNGIDGWNDQLWMPRATRRAIELQRRRVPRGEVRRETVALGWFGATPKQRRLDLYRPADDLEVDPRALPLLVVLDGADYLDRGHLHRTLDALIHDGAMAPIAAAFIDHAGPSRGIEYAANDQALRGLAEIVVPEAVERLGLGPQAGPKGGLGRAAILGASMGGLQALHAAVRRPDLFGRGIAQSVANFEAEYGHELTLTTLIRHAPPSPARLWLDAGDYEWLAAPGDALAALLQARGYDVTYRRHHGGHDQVSWNESLVDALPLLFPPAG